MYKKEFLDRLREELVGLPQNDIEERISFYNEMIEDIKEAKDISEEAAVAEVGPVSKVVNQIIGETPITKIVKEKIKPKRKLKGFEIALIVLGFPIWLPLLIVFITLIIVALFLLYTLAIALGSCAIGCIGSSIALLFNSFIMIGTNMDGALMSIGLAILGAGLGIIFVYLCINSVKITVKLMKKIIFKIKTLFVGRR